VSAYATHTRYWAREESAYLYCCFCCIFGCRAAASIATRISGFVVYLFQMFASMIEPTDDKLLRWFHLLLWAKEQKDKGDRRFADFDYSPSSGCGGEFVDDISMLTFECQKEPMLDAMAALLEYLGMLPQAKKVFPEGNFADD
jgi:hypothetical protein